MDMPKWKDRPIVDAKHSDELEIDAALNEFRDRMPRRQAEDTAHRAYLREHHSASAAHHLRGMRAANAAGDDKAAEKHSAMYAMHCRELGHDPYGEPDSSIQKRAEAQEKDEVYKFRAHKADGLLQPVAKGARLDLGAVLAKALPKGDEALAGANAIENQVHSGANQVAQDHFQEQGAKLAIVPPKPQHVNAIHGDYWRGHDNREMSIANSGRGHPNDPGPDHPADTQMRQGQLPANQLTGRTEKGVIMPTTGVRTANEIRGEASQANYAQSVAQGLDSRLEFGNFPPSVSPEPGHALDPQGGWAGSPGLNPAQSNSTAKTLESAFWSRLANAAKTEAGRFPMPPVAPWTGAGPYKKSEPDFWAVLVKAAELETGHPSKVGVKSAPVLPGAPEQWPAAQAVATDRALEAGGQLKAVATPEQHVHMPFAVGQHHGVHKMTQSHLESIQDNVPPYGRFDASDAGAPLPPAVYKPIPTLGYRNGAEVNEEVHQQIYQQQKVHGLPPHTASEPANQYTPAHIGAPEDHSAEQEFWQTLGRAAGLHKAIPKGDEGLLGQNGPENQLNRGVHGVMEDHLLEHGAQRKEVQPPREEPTVPQFMEGPKASAGQVPLKDLQLPSEHKYPIVGQRSPEDVIHETSTQADQMYDKMNEGVPRSQQLQQFPLTTSYASTAVHNLRGGQPEYHFWKWLGRAAGIGVQPVKPTNGLYDLPVDVDSK